MVIVNVDILSLLHSDNNKNNCKDINNTKKGPIIRNFISKAIKKYFLWKVFTDIS